MKIIKKGEIPNLTSEKECEYCRTLFTFSIQDVTKSDNGLCGYDYKVKCPLCGKILSVGNCIVENTRLYANERFTAYVREVDS